jgi:hypothetical protein
MVFLAPVRLSMQRVFSCGAPTLNPGQIDAIKWEEPLENHEHRRRPAEHDEGGPPVGGVAPGPGD